MYDYHKVTIKPGHMIVKEHGAQAVGLHVMITTGLMNVNAQQTHNYTL